MSDSSSSIAFYRTRSAIDVINVTFRLFRDQFASLAKGLFLLAGPFLVSAYAVTTVGSVLLGGILETIGIINVTAVTIGAVHIYHREGPGRMSLGQLWEMVYVHGCSLFGRQVQIVLVMGVSTPVVVVSMIWISIFLIGALSEAVPDALEETVGLIGGGLLVGGVCGWPLYALSQLMLLLPGQVDPERSMSLKRCWTLMRGHSGQTMGVFLLASVICVTVLSVGWVAHFVGTVMSNVGVSYVEIIGSVVSGLIAGVAQALALGFVYTAMTLQYYNLIEQHEQVSLENEVKQMEAGAPSPDSDLSSAHDPSVFRRTEASPESTPSSRWQPNSSTPPTR